MRAISELLPVSQAVCRGKFCAKGFEEAQIDIEADGHNAVLDI
jgi:hypothetical protein